MSLVCQQVLKMMVGNNLKDTQLQQIVDKTILFADRDEDGKINFEEFCSVSTHVYIDTKSKYICFNLLKTKRNLFYIRNQPVSRCKHCRSVIKINQLMMYRAKVAVYLEICTKHSTQSEHHKEFLNHKPGGTQRNRQGSKRLKWDVKHFVLSF